MAGSKFFGLKNKGKKRNKTVNESVDLPPKMEINEALVEEQLNAPVLTEAEVEDLFKSLNEPMPEVEKKKTKTEVIVEVNNQVITTAPTEELFIAYGLCYSEEAKKFLKIEIDYNPKTGYTKLRSSTHWADSAATALNKLNRVLSLKLIKREETF